MYGKKCHVHSNDCGLILIKCSFVLNGQSSKVLDQLLRKCLQNLLFNDDSFYHTFIFIHFFIHLFLSALSKHHLNSHAFEFKKTNARRNVAVWLAHFIKSKLSGRARGWEEAVVCSCLLSRADCNSNVLPGTASI